MRMLYDGSAEARRLGAHPTLTAYRDDSVVPESDRRRVSGWFVRYVGRREQRALTAHVRAIGSARTVLDFRSGSGRWRPVIDLLNPTTVLETDAEQLPYEDESVDLVFCHAVTQHLPHETQAAVLGELGRVTRRHVICSFTIRAGIPGVALRLRELALGRRSNAVSWGWLARAAADANLHAVRARGCTSHLGAERSVLFSKVRPVVDGL